MIPKMQLPEIVFISGNKVCTQLQCKRNIRLLHFGGGSDGFFFGFLPGGFKCEFLLTNVTAYNSNNSNNHFRWCRKEIQPVYQYFQPDKIYDQISKNYQKITK